MVSSQSTTISVKIPINWQIMSPRAKERLRRILGRDTRAIRAFLGVIEQHEDSLLTGKRRNKVDESGLDQLTITTNRGTSHRLSVPHDLKARFPRASPNELTECRQTAVSLYESYLSQKTNKRKSVCRPCKKSHSSRIPRWMFLSHVFSIVHKQDSSTRWWMDLRDSLDTAPLRSRRHDRLLIPIKVSPFHETQMKRGEIKAGQIYSDYKARWWLTLAVRVTSPLPVSTPKPLAVLGIDLGIRKAACTTLVTPEKVRETRYLVERDKLLAIKRYDELFTELQHEMESRRSNGQESDKFAMKLRRLRRKRENIAKEYDRILVRNLLDYVLELSREYTLYVALGRLQNIREVARRGNGKGPLFRGMIHSWAFARITNGLKHQLLQWGWQVEGKDSRFRTVSEAWTSIVCWKCGSKGRRPRQNFFVCPSCGHKTNADRNGSINIAGRLIMLTDSLRSVRGLGKWASSADAAQSQRPKAQGISSRGKSLLPSENVASRSKESAVVRLVQRDLPSFGDESGKSDYDLTVVRAVENPSAAGNDAARQQQRKETRTVGGTQSQ